MQELKKNGPPAAPAVVLQEKKKKDPPQSRVQAQVTAPRRTTQNNYRVQETWEEHTPFYVHYSESLEVLPLTCQHSTQLLLFFKRRKGKEKLPQGSGHMGRVEAAATCLFSNTEFM